MAKRKAADVEEATTSDEELPSFDSHEDEFFYACANAYDVSNIREAAKRLIAAKKGE